MASSEQEMDTNCQENDNTGVLTHSSADDKVGPPTIHTEAENTATPVEKSVEESSVVAEKASDTMEVDSQPTAPAEENTSLENTLATVPEVKSDSSKTVENGQETNKSETGKDCETEEAKERSVQSAEASKGNSIPSVSSSASLSKDGSVGFESKIGESVCDSESKVGESLCGIADSVDANAQGLFDAPGSGDSCPSLISGEDSNLPDNANLPPAKEGEGGPTSFQSSFQFFLHKTNPAVAAEMPSEDSSDGSLLDSSNNCKPASTTPFNTANDECTKISMGSLDAANGEESMDSKDGGIGDTPDSNTNTPNTEKKRKKAYRGNDLIKVRQRLAAMAGVAELTDEEFTAEKLFEYQWPQNERSSDWYMIQEQVSEYLGVLSFKRKYPDMGRRPSEPKERQFLMEKGIVTEMQCDLGLTAVKMDDVMDLMSKDYPEKYEEFMLVLRERQRQQQLETRRQRDEQKKQGKEREEKREELKLERANPVLMMKKAVQAAADFNKQFMRERREERRAYFDLQTHEVHFNKGTYKTLPAEATKVGAYPVALIPGQFQDYYKRYSANELKYFPLNTTMYSPPRAMRDIYCDPVQSEEEEEQEGEEQTKPEVRDVNSASAGESSLKKRRIKKEGDSSGSDSENTGGADDGASDAPSAASSQRSTTRTGRSTPLAKTPRSARKRGAPANGTDAVSEKKKVKKVKPPTPTPSPLPSPPPAAANARDYKKSPLGSKNPKPRKRSSGSRSDSTHPITTVIRLERGPEGQTSYGEVVRESSVQCSVCSGQEGRDGKGEEQELVQCADCKKHGHPSCLELTEEMISVIKTYPWQCMECKTCVECKDPSHEERMLFCDHCDRGYHTFCVGVNRIPTGRWECISCRGDYLYKGSRGSRGRPKLSI